MQNGELTTNKCSQAGPASIAAGVLKELRALRDGGQVDDLFGAIRVPLRNGSYLAAAPLKGIPVHISGSRGARFSAKTDEYGIYEFASLPPDTYSIEPELPIGLTTGQTTLTTFDIGSTFGDRAGCRLDISPHLDNQISETGAYVWQRH